MSRQFYCMERKIGELRKQSSRRYRCLFRVVFAKYLGHYQQQPKLRENKPDSSRGRNQEEVLEVDRIHIEESTNLCHKARPHHLESSRPNDDKEAKEEHITSRNGDRNEKNEQQLNRTRKEGLGQSELVGECRLVAYAPLGVTGVNFDLGFRQYNQNRIHDVELPNWASTPEEFIRKHRGALESDYVPHPKRLTYSEWLSILIHQCRLPVISLLTYTNLKHDNSIHKHNSLIQSTSTTTATTTTNTTNSSSSSSSTSTTPNSTKPTTFFQRLLSDNNPNDYFHSIFNTHTLFDKIEFINHKWCTIKHSNINDIGISIETLKLKENTITQLNSIYLIVIPAFCCPSKQESTLVNTINKDLSYTDIYRSTNLLKTRLFSTGNSSMLSAVAAAAAAGLVTTTMAATTTTPPPPLPLTTTTISENQLPKSNWERLASAVFTINSRGIIDRYFWIPTDQQSIEYKNNNIEPLEQYGLFYDSYRSSQYG
ncbi:unnamed protein product [Schistosoma mattheei]|uniref:Uncharacterized protein n=1 Tax=Schistosoma mattheei TaxID=31246 RepID=A0A183PB24_9TREM|nr:unnamed protein product [Schistosoma mattheei]